jgi:hypothetical protein
MNAPRRAVAGVLPHSFPQADRRPARVVDKHEKPNSINWLVAAKAVGKLYGAWYRL